MAARTISLGISGLHVPRTAHIRICYEPTWTQGSSRNSCLLSPWQWTWKLVAPLTSSRKVFPHPARNFLSHHMALPVLLWAPPILPPRPAPPFWVVTVPGSFGEQKWMQEQRHGQEQMCSRTFPADSCTHADAGAQHTCLDLSSAKRLQMDHCSAHSLCTGLGVNIFSQGNFSRKIKSQTKAKRSWYPKDSLWVN